MQKICDRRQEKKVVFFKHKLTSKHSKWSSLNIAGDFMLKVSLMAMTNLSYMVEFFFFSQNCHPSR